MQLRKYDLVWIKVNNKKRVGIELHVRKHVAVERPYVASLKGLQVCSETISNRMLIKAQLTPSQLAELPCGKRVLTLNKAFEIVAVNRIFNDKAARRERRAYYCKRCRGFHTTSKTKIPSALLHRLRRSVCNAR